MRDRRNQGGGDGDGDNIVPGLLHEPAYDDIEETGVRQYAEENNRENKQDAVTGGGLDTIRDIAHDVYRRVSENQSRNRRDHAQHDDR